MVTKRTADGAVIVIDTREQEPYDFGAPSMRRKLDAGDYSLAGLETQVAIERKSLDDYVSTVIRNRRRFGAELRRLAAYDFACVVVEADLADILAGRYRSGARPESVLGATISILADKRVPVFFCSERRLARRFVESLLLRLHGNLTREPSEPSEREDPDS